MIGESCGRKRERTENKHSNQIKLCDVLIKEHCGGDDMQVREIGGQRGEGRLSDH